MNGLGGGGKVRRGGREAVHWFSGGAARGWNGIKLTTRKRARIKTQTKKEGSKGRKTMTETTQRDCDCVRASWCPCLWPIS